MTLALAVGMGLSVTASAAIVGSSHDFTDSIKGREGNAGAGTATSEAWNARKEICRVCHVPHDHGRTYGLAGLQWNHKVSTATYTMYDSTWSPTLTGVQSAQPDGTSKQCLACHDGTVAIDTYDKYATAAIWFDDSAGGYDIDYVVSAFLDGANIDLRMTHPLSIQFPVGEIGTDFNDPATQTWIGGRTVASTLDNGKVQCSTCHDVHSTNIAPSGHMLRQAQTVAQGGVPSGMCLTCHIK